MFTTKDPCGITTFEKSIKNSHWRNHIEDAINEYSIIRLVDLG
jgi:hypothetical protein